MKRRDFGMMSDSKDTTGNFPIFGDSDSEEEFILSMAKFNEMNSSSCSDDIDDSSDSDEVTGIDFGTAASGKCLFVCLFVLCHFQQYFSYVALTDSLISSHLSREEPILDSFPLCQTTTGIFL